MSMTRTWTRTMTRRKGTRRVGFKQAALLLSRGPVLIRMLSDTTAPLLQTCNFWVYPGSGGGPIAYIRLQMIDRGAIMPGKFLESMADASDELIQFGLALFDRDGRLKAEIQSKGTGVWGEELSGEGTDRGLFYIEEMKVRDEYRGCGIGTWMLEHVWDLEGMESARFIFCWPTVLPQDMPFAELMDSTGAVSSQAEVEFEERRTGIEYFFHKVTIS